MLTSSSRQFWALLSAIFAALTAIFAKLGVEEVNSDFATFLRTITILCVLAALLFTKDQFQSVRMHFAQKFLLFMPFRSGNWGFLAVLF